jgi:hypothetical protein
MFKKFDQWVDRALDKKWVRVLVFTALIINLVLGTIGMMALLFLLG